MRDINVERERDIDKERERDIDRERELLTFSKRAKETEIK